jgi:hypothetical protein
MARIERGEGENLQAAGMPLWMTLSMPAAGAPTVSHRAMLAVRVRGAEAARLVVKVRHRR